MKVEHDHTKLVQILNPALLLHQILAVSSASPRHRGEDIILGSAAAFLYATDVNIKEKSITA